MTKRYIYIHQLKNINILYIPIYTVILRQEKIYLFKIFTQN